ncbi:MAG: FkbM family methyltransferase [Thermoflavifilum sp.]|jgi:FkbM family methyltransferase|uniref:FkbM family methyltransferase n=1 Tax=Thermoflavifilum sp. TaxID=1968839 RepID=UPI0018A4B2EC|nr:FkbM family methyltransferase [Thermoflavifilum sp.]QOR75576.1 MAG: FkbM family methyltransferase [Thermoflavifilum sp.]
MHIVDQVLRRKEFEQRPPVLIDIGASGAIHSRWKAIAPYSVCITFDPDTREYAYVEQEHKHYKKLYTMHCGVGDEDQASRTFYLTRSPYCSSFLKPNAEKLKPYAFARKYMIEREVSYEIKTIKSVLRELNIAYIDWFKADSQGLDLHIFSALGDKLIKGIIAAELEPGIMDTYDGEDKLHHILSFMEKYPFFLSELHVKGISRISPEHIDEITRNSIFKRLIAASHKKNAGWVEMLYLNTFDEDDVREIRDYMLGIVIALLNEEYGFALELSRKAKLHFNDAIFNDLERFAIKKIKSNVIHLRFIDELKKKFLHK